MSESFSDLLAIVGTIIESVSEPIGEGLAEAKKHNPFHGKELGHHAHLGNKSPEHGKNDEEHVWSCHKTGPYKQLCIGTGAKNKGWHKKVSTDRVGPISKKEYNTQYKHGVASKKYVKAFRSGHGSTGSSELDKAIEGKRHKINMSHPAAHKHAAEWRAKHGKAAPGSANSHSRHEKDTPDVDYSKVTKAVNSKPENIKARMAALKGKPGLKKKESTKGTALSKLAQRLQAKAGKGGLSNLKGKFKKGGLEKVAKTGKHPAMSKLTAKLAKSAEAIKAKKAKKNKKKHVDAKGLAAVNKFKKSDKAAKAG